MGKKLKTKLEIISWSVAKTLVFVAGSITGIIIFIEIINSLAH